jgi:hypothetical protein
MWRGDLFEVELGSGMGVCSPQCSHATPTPFLRFACRGRPNKRLRRQGGCAGSATNSNPTRGDSARLLQGPPPPTLFHALRSSGKEAVRGSHLRSASRRCCCSELRIVADHQCQRPIERSVTIHVP